MFLRRSALAVARKSFVRPPIATRTFASNVKRFEAEGKAKIDPKPGQPSKSVKTLEEITSEDDLLPPGAEPGTVPTDLEQSTGLERLEILGKMQGVDVFDMRPLDASRLGTLDDPIIVYTAGNEQYAGCTGYPADSHWVIWLVMTRDRPLERCPECGNCIKMEYIGPLEDEHDHDHHQHEEPKTMIDFIRPEYKL